MIATLPLIFPLFWLFLCHYPFHPFPIRGSLTPSLALLTSPFSNILPCPTDEPEVTIKGFDGNWYLQRMDVKLTCKADANPPATEYRWTT